MKKFLITGLACAGLVLATAEPAFAHGGQYRGPGDVVPPNPGGGGGRTPGPSGPSTPGPSGPSTPGPAGPGTPGPAGPATGGPGAPAPAGGGGPTTGGGIQLVDDLTRWQFWWEFNKDPFINLREAVFDQGTVSNSEEFFMGAGLQQTSKDTLRPTKDEIRNKILPALARLLESSDQRDIVSSTLIAMAKIGEDSDEVKIIDVMRGKLSSNVQEVAETAALSMGISQRPDGVDDMIELVKDSKAGQALTESAEVNNRTRAFAAYGLGLVGWATSDNDLKTKIFKALDEVLKDESASERNIRVAVINAIGLLRPDASEAKGKELLLSCLESLESYWNERLGAGEQIIQSHVPHSVAKLFAEVDIEADEELAKRRNEFKQAYLDEVTGRAKFKRSQINIVQSAIVALGHMTAPNLGRKDTEKFDYEISEAISEYYKKGKDQQATYFALVALGEIGGTENRDHLLDALRTGQDALEKPWAAMGLGVYAYRMYDELGDKASTEVRLIGEQLQSWLSKSKNPDLQASISVALGLTKYQDAADEMRELLVKVQNRDMLAGYICIGLALMDDQRSTDVIKDLVEKSVRRPERLQQAAIALGKLGDKSAATLLQKMMTEGDTNLAKMAAIASALGFIGDRRSIDPCIEMMNDEGLTDISRAFAAVALGGIAMQELLPWNSKIAINMNYRASVETLTNRVSGILDIL